jgi:hypothetical protein
MWVLQLVARLTDPKQEHHRKLQFTYWMQWQLHKQLEGAAEYAKKRRVVLKGDLPIGMPSPVPVHYLCLSGPVSAIKGQIHTHTHTHTQRERERERERGREGHSDSASSVRVASKVCLWSEGSRSLLLRMLTWANPLRESNQGREAGFWLGRGRGRRQEETRGQGSCMPPASHQLLLSELCPKKWENACGYLLQLCAASGSQCPGL